jgi:hypothetical protein
LKQYYIPLGIYAVFVVISTIFAKDTQTALWGFVDMYQGMFVLLSYVLITFLTINFVNSERDVNLFVKAFTFLMIIEGLIGITQYFGFDFFQSGIGKSLIVPGNIKVDGLSFSFGPKTIYGTLFNTNFVGSFATLMLPLSVAFLFTSKTKKQRIISSISTLMMLFVWIGCNSRAGYLGFTVSAIFAVFLFRSVIKRYWKVSVGLIMTLIILILALNSVSNGNIINRLKTFNIINQIEEVKNINKNGIKFEEIILGTNSFSIKTSSETLHAKIDTDKVYFSDENNNELKITQKNNQIIINDPRYSEYRIIIPKQYLGIEVQRATYWDWMNMNFYILEDGVKMLGTGGRILEPIIAERYKGFDGLETFMSGRGYIWSRTFPMLDTYFIKGSGPDNCPIAFPQDDFVNKLNAGMDTNMVVDKPHNMYLQIAINSGLISLIAFLSVCGLYIINSTRIYSKMIFDSLVKYVGASCLVGIIGYLVAGIFNDGIVSVSPVFWVLLGLGISINYKMKTN